MTDVLITAQEARKLRPKQYTVKGILEYLNSLIVKQSKEGFNQLIINSFHNSVGFTDVDPEDMKEIQKKLLDAGYTFRYGEVPDRGNIIRYIKITW